jgi:uncharacterized protein YjiS (DUF1127 family)
MMRLTASRRSPFHLSPAVWWARPPQALRGVLRLLAAWRLRAEYRCALRRLLVLGPHLVQDIGLLPVHARREAVKPFWQA